jgi:outer membrane murein-binding lipoprotein Lpp
MATIRVALLALFMAASPVPLAAASAALGPDGTAADAPVTAAMLRDFGSQLMHELGASLAALEARLDARIDNVSSAVRDLDIKVDGLAGKVRDLDIKVDGLAGEVRNLDIKVDGLTVDVRDLSESVLTPAVGARGDACARVAVASSFVSVGGALLKQCSAVPLPEPLAARAPADAASSNFFLTSAHCYENETAGKVIFFPKATTQIGGVEGCALVAQFLRPPSPDALDLAVVRCAVAVPLPPTRLSSHPYVAHTRVVLAGFSRGEHLDPALSARIVGGATCATFALHTKHTRLSDSLQTPVAVASEGPVPPSRGYTEDALLPTAFAPAAAGAAPPGFVESSPWEGMSGGAVFDTRCGLLGITESRAVFAQGGQFVRLTPDVLERVAAAVAAAKAGS